MNYLRWLSVGLLLYSGTSVFGNESWLEGTWVVSKEHTIAALAQGSAQAKKALEEGSLEVEAKWIVESGTIQIERKSSQLERTVYYIRPIEEGIFEIVFDLPDGEQNYVIIHRTDFGFCYRYGGDYSHPPMQKPFAECYVRVDT